MPALAYRDFWLRCFSAISVLALWQVAAGLAASPLLPAPASVAAALVNILGPDNGLDPLERVPDLIADPDVRLHLYTKRYRPGRKLGHATVLGPDLDTARAKTLRARALLQGEHP